jgi:hypothetical protein
MSANIFKKMGGRAMCVTEAFSKVQEKTNAGNVIALSL